MPERRSKTLVNPFQRTLIARMAFYAVIYHFTLWNFLVFWRLLATAGRGRPQQSGSLSQEFTPLLLCMVALVPIFIWDALKYSHRVAGPLVQINRAIRDVADGRPVRHVRLREKDELKELQDDFNDMLDYLSASGAVALASDERASDERASDERASDERASEVDKLNACRDALAGAIEEEASCASWCERNASSEQ
jgi:methyl-accepting chemotaxis protein